MDGFTILRSCGGAWGFGPEAYPVAMIFLASPFVGTDSCFLQPRIVPQLLEHRQAGNPKRRCSSSKVRKSQRLVLILDLGVDDGPIPTRHLLETRFLPSTPRAMV